MWSCVLRMTLIYAPTMSSQAKISSFFQRGSNKVPIEMKKDNENVDQISVKSSDSNASSTITTKRPADDLDTNTEDENESASPNKKLHVLEENSVAPNQQQKDMAEQNRIKAKMLLTGKQTSGLVTAMGLSWFSALEAEFSKPYFIKLSKYVEEERKKHTVYPAVEQVFTWTNMVPIKDTTVVILGQDPYHGPNQAHGLSFSVPKGIALPPSLENMYKELSSDIDGFNRPSHGCLSGWAEQGVLLLNAVLTVRAHCANSHKDQGWEVFTDAVVAWLDKNTEGTVFMLWGSYAHKKGARINRKKHHVLQGVHPSPLSAYRGFFGCKHFSKCNELLASQGKTPIDWSRFV